ncbi:MAG: hypothetical protein VX486_10075, partial [Pseudomonadota bacterium]|nr:hypothetical protein [Pseudomonadota bacterium]
MTDSDIFQERVLKVPIPDRHYLILVAPDGNYLGVDQDGFTTTYPHANDRIMWDECGAGSFRHVLADTEIVKKSVDGDGCQLSLEGTLLDGLGKPTGE